MVTTNSLAEEMAHEILKKQATIKENISVTLEQRFINLLEDMEDEGVLSGSLELDEEEASQVGDLVERERKNGFRFRLDRVITKTVNEKNVQVGVTTTDYSLFVSLEHLR